MANEDKDNATDRPIVVDYDNVDVADIMAQIRRKIGSKAPDLSDNPAFGPDLSPPAAGWRKTTKRIVLQIMRPFMPLIRRLIVYVTADTNRRVDEASAKLTTTMEYTKLLHALAHNLVVEITKLKIEEEALKSKMRVMEKDFERLEKREKTVEKKAFP